MIPLKKGFQEGCKPFIGFDGYFLKGQHGTLLPVVGYDANRQIYPFAYAIVEKETYISWKWFIENLIGGLDIQNDGAWTLMSDK